MCPQRRCVIFFQRVSLSWTHDTPQVLRGKAQQLQKRRSQMQMEAQGLCAACQSTALDNHALILQRTVCLFRFFNEPLALLLAACAAMFSATCIA